MSAPRKSKKLQYPTELPTWKGLRFFSNDNTKVHKTDSWGDERRVAQTFELLTYLKNYSHPNIVPILDCQKHSSTEYSYVMPLMARLSDSEEELVDYLSSGFDIRKDYKDRIYRLKKKHPKLYQVIKKINSWEVYIDLHEGNVMKDRYGNIRLIDIEGFGLSRFTATHIINEITIRR